MIKLRNVNSVHVFHSNLFEMGTHGDGMYQEML